MKKTIFACLLLSALTITGCNNNNASGGKSYNDGFTYAKDSLFTSELAINNIVEPEYVKPTIKTPKLAIDNRHFTEDEIVKSDYSASGLLVVKNEYGNIGFYSLIADDYILERQYEKEWLDYTVLQSSHVGFYLKVRYEDTLKVVDSFGNLLYDGDYDSTLTIVDTYDHDNYATMMSDELGTIYFKYDSKTGHAKQTSVIIDDDPEPVTPTDVYDGPFIPELYQEDWQDLTPYGLEDYSLVDVGNGLYYIFKETEKQFQFFVDPGTCSTLGVVGKSFYYQQKIELDQYATNYTYSEGNQKFSLATYSINLENGKKSEHNYMALFSSLTPLVDENLKVVCSVLEYDVINKDYVKAERVSKIIDPQFKIHDDISGLEFRYFAKIKSAYFNFATKVLYNSNLEPITWLGNLEGLKFNTNMEMFVGKLDGKYGVVGLDGKVKVEFKFTELYADDYANGVLIGLIGNEVYRVRPNQATLTKVGVSSFQKIAENLFSCVTDEDTKLYFSTTQDLFEYPLSGAYMYVTQKTILGNITYSFVPYSTTDFTYSRINYTDVNPQTVPAATKGEELEESIDVGYEEKDAIPLSLGYNLGHDNRTTNGELYSYTPTFDGYFNLYTQYNQDNFQNVTLTRLVNVYYFDNEDVSHNVSFDSSISYYSTTTKGENEYDAKYTFLLEKGVKYYVSVFENTSLITQLYNLYLDYERGDNYNYPLYVNVDVEESQIFEFEMPDNKTYVDYFYVRFIAPETGYYAIKSPEGQSKVLTSSNYSGGTYDSEKGMYIYFKDNEGIIEVGNNIQDNVEFEFVFEEAEIPEGYSLENPYEITYGTNYIYSEKGYITRYSLLNLATVYFAFEPESDGLYSFSQNFYSSSYTYSNPEWNIYDSKGGKVDLDSRYVNDFGRYLVKEGEKVIFSFEVNGSYSVRLTSLTINSYTGYAFEEMATYSSSSFSVSSKYAYYVRYTASGDETDIFEIESERFEYGNSTLSYRVDKGENEGEFKLANFDSNTGHYYTDAIVLENGDRVIFRFDLNESASETYYSAIISARYSYDDEKAVQLNTSTTFESSEAYYQHYKYTNNTSGSVDVGFVVTSSNTTDVYFEMSTIGYCKNDKNVMNVVPAVTSSGAPNMTDNVITLKAGESLYLSTYSIYDFTFEIVDDLSYYVNLKSVQYPSYQWTFDQVNNMYNSNEHTSDITFHIQEAGSLSFQYNQNGYNMGLYSYGVIYVNNEQYKSYYDNNGTDQVTIEDLVPGDVVQVVYFNEYNPIASYYVTLTNVTFTPANA